MLYLNLRPEFEYPLVEPQQELFERLAQSARQEGWAGRLKIFDRYGELHLPEEEHRLWSPHLYFYLVEHDGREFLHGHFAPRLHIWTLVWICYLFLGFTAFFAAMLAAAQWQLGMMLWGVPVALISLFLWLLLLVAANVGMHWSRDQMHYLKTRFESLLQPEQLPADSPLSR